MGFRKAEPKQAALKVSIYGPQGSGKTFTSLLVAEGIANSIGKRIAFVDTERGTDFYAKDVPARTVHPKAFDFDALYTKSLAKILGEVKQLPTSEYGVIVIDSISHVWDAAIDAYDGKKSKRGDIPMWAWSKIKRPYKDLIRFLIDSPFHVFLLGRQKNVFEAVPDDPEKVQKVGVAMRAEGETAYEPHICLRMEGQQRKNNPDVTDYLMHVEKDRSGVLAGRVFRNPRFEVFEPLLALLGHEQAQEEDEEERIAADSELHQEAEDKARDKAAKSKKHFSELSTQLREAAGNLAAIGEVGQAIKKKRRYMIDEHVQALRALFGQIRDEAVEAEAGDF